MPLLNRTKFIIKQIGKWEHLLEHILTQKNEGIIENILWSTFLLKRSISETGWTCWLHIEMWDGTKEPFSGTNLLYCWKAAAKSVIGRYIEKEQRRLWFQ
jgi:hypothetical protein